MPTRRRPVCDEVLLRERLERLVATYDESTITPDPLELVHRYASPRDQEIAGFLAAAFAYGRAELIVRSVAWIFDRMGPSPDVYLVETFTPADAVKRFRGFSHRFHKTPDLVGLLERLASTLRQYGSLGRLFESCHDANDDDVGHSLTRFVGAIITTVGAPMPRSLSYLLASPADGSACKRLNLFLRWMVRREAPDLGLWTFVEPRQLVIPLDTHVHRIATFLGINERRSADWKTALAITKHLRRFHEGDPIRYDFALCRLGILDLCSRRQRIELCEVCLLNDVCRLRLTPP